MNDLYKLLDVYTSAKNKDKDEALEDLLKNLVATCAAYEGHIEKTDKHLDDMTAVAIITKDQLATAEQRITDTLVKMRRMKK